MPKGFWEPGDQKRQTELRQKSEGERGDSAPIEVVRWGGAAGCDGIGGQDAGEGRERRDDTIHQSTDIQGEIVEQD